MMGACGNQFFQYAFARQLQEDIGGDLVIDYSLVKNNPNLWSGSDNLLRDFNTIEYEYLAKENNPKLFVIRCINKIRRMWKLEVFDKRTYKLYQLCAKILVPFGIIYWDSSYFPFRVRRRKNVLINGYFESPRYFQRINDIICKELTPKHQLLEQNLELYNIIQKRAAVCITIKRQDVENPDISDVYDYDIDYFYHAVEYIKEREQAPVFIVFSDDIVWCKQNFHIEGEVYYEKEGNPIWEKVRLMSGCKHFVIHNSTFSWWVQHLSQRQGKIVIAPVKWMLRDDQPIDIYEDNWIYMRNDGTIQETHD